MQKVKEKGVEKAEEEKGRTDEPEVYLRVVMSGKS